MFIATVIFWIGRKQYVLVPPAPPNPHSFLNVCPHRAHLRHARPRARDHRASAWAIGSFLLIPKFGFVIAACLALVAVIGSAGSACWLQLEAARGKHPDDAIDGVRAVLRVLVLFALVTPFWSLFDQKASTWVLQADAMTKPRWFQSSQMQALNPLLVMLLIPFNNLVLYPALQRFGYEMTALAAHDRRHRVLRSLVDRGRRHAGGARRRQRVLDHVAGAAVRAAHLRRSARLRHRTRVRLQPGARAMKGVLMAFWNLSVTIGNLWVLLANASVRSEAVIAQIAGTGLSENAFLMFFFAAFALVVALIFALYARRYPMQDHYRRQ